MNARTDLKKLAEVLASISASAFIRVNLAASDSNSQTDGLRCRFFAEILGAAFTGRGAAW
jgi:hypothetical protein